jgi:uncharacterized protein (DUF433 family)
MGLNSLKMLIFHYQSKAILDYTNYISINPNVRFGKPCIKGSRITVFDVLSWLASGMDQKQILEDYPEINVKQIQACLFYAADREHKLKVA